MRRCLGPASGVLVLWLTVEGCHWVFPYSSGPQGERHGPDVARDLGRDLARPDLPASDRRSTDVSSGCPAGCTCDCASTSCYFDCDGAATVNCKQSDSKWMCSVTFPGGGFVASDIISPTGPCEPCATMKRTTWLDAGP
jgi:hypothetical protein